MKLLSSKLLAAEHFKGFYWYCAACDALHPVYLEQVKNEQGEVLQKDTWTWNGDFETPTFNPSFRVNMGSYPDGRKKECHTIITNGQVAYCGDSTTGHAGETLPMADIPADWYA